MNENPEGTPNPLNPAPADEAKTDTAPVEPAPAEARAEAPAPAAEAPAPVSEEPAGTVVEPVKKKKTGLIVIIVILALAIIGGAVAAILILNPFGNGNGGGSGGGDKYAVSKAIVKLLSSTEGPKKLGTKGTVEVTAGSASIPFKTIDATIDAGYDVETGKSSGDVTLGVAFSSTDEITIKLSEMLADKKLYLKATTDKEVDTTDIDEDDETAQYSLMIASFINMLGGKWISMSLTDATSGLPSGSTNETAQCLIEAMKDTSDTKIDLGGIYENNKFVTSSTDSLKISKKNDPLYKLGIDSEKAASFVNAVANELGSSDAAKCIDTTSSEEVTAEQISEIVKELPTVYVEVNSDYNFTRFYTNYTASDESLGIKVDLTLNYNPTIEATAPSDSIKLEDLFRSMYQNPSALD
jgi:hypothetical protein